MTERDKNKEKGHYHPLTLAMLKIGKIFDDLSFEMADGPKGPYADKVTLVS